MNVLEKHPWAQKRVAVDWSPYLVSAGTTISSSVWLDTKAVVTLGGAAVNGAVSSVVASGGTAGDTAYVENRVTFADGTSDVVTIMMPIVIKGWPV